MNEQITDQELVDWETDLAGGCTVDTQLGLAFLRVVERMRDAENARDAWIEEAVKLGYQEVLA